MSAAIIIAMPIPSALINALWTSCISFSRENSTQKLFTITAGITSHTSIAAISLLPLIVSFSVLNRMYPANIYRNITTVCLNTISAASNSASPVPSPFDSNQMLLRNILKPLHNPLKPRHKAGAINKRAFCYPSRFTLAMSPANTIDTIDTSLIRMLIDGPDVSLNGSPMVSPTTAALWLSEPLPPK